MLVAIAPHGNTYEDKRAEAREKKLNDARNAATQELNSYAWVDKGKGIARIPIDRAMELTLPILRQKKPAPANPIETPAPKRRLHGASPAPAVPPAPLPAAAGNTETDVSRGPEFRKSRISPPRRAIRPARYQGPSRARATPAASPSPASDQPRQLSAGTPVQKPPGNSDSYCRKDVAMSFPSRNAT